jgi:hypothetical protein
LETVAFASRESDISESEVFCDDPQPANTRKIIPKMGMYNFFVIEFISVFFG